LEEQLSEARLECSRLKTELVSEKSSWEITKSEMTSSINKVGLICLFEFRILFDKTFVIDILVGRRTAVKFREI
jgi:hypothetical protein